MVRDASNHVLPLRCDMRRCRNGFLHLSKCERNQGPSLLHMERDPL